MTTLGRCKVCASSLLKDINKRLANDQSFQSVADWCKAKGFPVTRQKLADHKKHITDPRQTLVEHSRRNPAIKSNVSNDDFLQAVIDVSAAKIEADPDSIGVMHGLKAVQIREARREKSVNVLMLLARAFTGNIETQPVELIEGSYTELPQEA